MGGDRGVSVPHIPCVACEGIACRNLTQGCLVVMVWPYVEEDEDQHEPRDAL